MAFVECVLPGPSQRKRDVQNSVVKSAGRAIQILEFFDHIQREACVSEISRALRYPQSSTSALLRSLVSMGYLLHDRFKRTYFPTRRVSLLGNWVDPALLQQGALLMVADDLARETGLDAVMATANGLYAQYIYAHHGAPATEAVGGPMVGAMRPIAPTAVGRALLSSFDENHVTKLLRRINAERDEGEPTIVVPEFLAALRQDRRRGFFTGQGAEDGHAGLASLLDRNRQLLVLAVEGDEAELAGRQDTLVASLRTAVARHVQGVSLLSS
jgi:DNA-binding IclR family transcriptional regulator